MRFPTRTVNWLSFEVVSKETPSIEQTHGKKWACTARSPRYGSDANKKWRDNGKSPLGTNAASAAFIGGIEVKYNWADITIGSACIALTQEFLGLLRNRNGGVTCRLVLLNFV